MSGSDVRLEWRGVFGSTEVEGLHAEGFDHQAAPYDWQGQVERHSLGWVTARRDGLLIGWVNVAWDGGSHAFLLDTLVTADSRHSGVATQLVAIATDQAQQAGCEWLHVDFDEELEAFYFGACGFTSTPAGVIALRGSASI